MADLLKKRWLDEQVLGLLRDAHATQLPFVGKRYLQVRSFHTFRHEKGHKDYDPSGMITATISDTHTALSCRFTLDAEKKFEQDKGYKLTSIRGAVLGKLTGLLCLELSSSGPGANIVLEIHGFKIYSAPRVDGACFGQPSWMTQLPETQKLLNSHQILRLLSMNTAEEVRSQAGFTSDSSVPSNHSRTIQTQGTKRKRFSPTPEQDKLKLPDRHDLPAATKARTSTMPTEASLRSRKRLHTGWGDFADLSYYDCQIPAAQRTMLEQDSCWMPKGDYKIEPIRYRRRVDAKDQQSRLDSSLNANIEKVPRKSQNSDDEGSDVISWAESVHSTTKTRPEATAPRNKDTVSLADLNRLRAQIVSHKPPEISDDESMDESSDLPLRQEDISTKAFIPPPLPELFLETDNQKAILHEQEDLAELDEQPVEPLGLQIPLPQKGDSSQLGREDVPSTADEIMSQTVAVEDPISVRSVDDAQITTTLLSSPQITGSSQHPEIDSTMNHADVLKPQDSRQRLPPYEIAAGSRTTSSPTTDNKKNGLPNPYDIAKRRTPQKVIRRRTFSPSYLTQSRLSSGPQHMSSPLNTNTKVIPSTIVRNGSPALSPELFHAPRSESPDDFLPIRPHPSLKSDSSARPTAVVPVSTPKGFVSTNQDEGIVIETPIIETPIIETPMIPETTLHKRRISRVKFDLQRLIASDDGLEVSDLLRRDRENFVKLHKPPPEQLLNLAEYVNTSPSQSSAQSQVSHDRMSINTSPAVVVTEVIMPEVLVAQDTPSLDRTNVAVANIADISQVQDSMEEVNLNRTNGSQIVPSTSSAASSATSISFGPLGFKVVIRQARPVPDQDNLIKKAQAMNIGQIEDSQIVQQSSSEALRTLSDILTSNSSEKQPVHDVMSWSNKTSE